MFRMNLLTPLLKTKGFLTGGEMTKTLTKSWGTYDANLLAKRYTMPFYDIKKTWSTLNRFVHFMMNANKNPNLKIFFGSLTDIYFDLFQTAALHSRSKFLDSAGFYCDSEAFEYGLSTNALNLETLNADIVFIPDVIYNDALMNEFTSRLAIICGIGTTDTTEPLDFPFIGDPDNINHILFYTQLIKLLLRPIRLTK